MWLPPLAPWLKEYDPPGPGQLSVCLSHLIADSGHAASLRSFSLAVLDSVMGKLVVTDCG